LFTNTTSQIHHDNDGLYLEDQALQLIHNKLQESSMSLSLIINFSNACPDWHKHCIVKVSSIVEASLLWKNHVQVLPSNCICKNMIREKCILIGPKQKNRITSQVIGIDDSLRIHYSVDNVFDGDVNRLNHWVYPF